MGARKILFPIALAVVWVLMAGWPCRFASFARSTPRPRPVAEQPVHIRCRGRGAAQRAPRAATAIGFGPAMNGLPPVSSKSVAIGRPNGRRQSTLMRASRPGRPWASSMPTTWQRGLGVALGKPRVWRTSCATLVEQRESFVTVSRSTG